MSVIGTAKILHGRWGWKGSNGTFREELNIFLAPFQPPSFHVGKHAHPRWRGVCAPCRSWWGVDGGLRQWWWRSPWRSLTDTAPVLLSPLLRAQVITGLNHGHTGYVLFKAKLTTLLSCLSISFVRYVPIVQIEPLPRNFAKNVLSRPRALNASVGGTGSDPFLNRETSSASKD